jgi:phenylalanyl-tRNA synthetase beta chain
LREAAIRFRITGETDRIGPDAEPNIESLMGVREIPRVGLVLAGTVRPAGWNVPEFRAGFFEAKGLVERLVPGAWFEPAERPFLHPGRSAAVRLGEREVGWVGELHPGVAERFELGGWPVAAFDLAVVVPSTVPVGEMLEAVEALRSPILAEVRVFDVYEGPQVPEGHKSVALSLTFQAEETLTDEEADAELGRISARLQEEFGATLRS